MSDFDKEMEAAATKGDVAELKRLVESGGRINPPGMHSPLVWACCRGNLEAARWLLDAGAQPDGASDAPLHFTPVMGAAYCGSLELVRLLFDRGADLNRVDDNGKGALSRAEEQKHPAVADFLKNPPPRLPPADEIAFTYPLQDRVLQEIFNFPRRERISLVRKSLYGPVEAITRQDFSELADLSSLRKAFALHRERGGKVSEEDIFEGKLDKPHYPRLTGKHPGDAGA